MAGDDTDQDRENYGTSVSRAATHALAGYTYATQAAATSCLLRRKGQGRRPRASALRDFYEEVLTEPLPPELVHALQARIG